MAQKKIKHLNLEEKWALIEREELSPVSVRRQCELLDLNRSSFYYEPVPVSQKIWLSRIRLMKSTRSIRSTVPAGCRGSLKHLDILWDASIQDISCALRALRLCFPQEEYFKAASGSSRLSVPLAEITRTNQVWSMDITYIRLKKGFVYLAVVMDWKSRYVLSWKVSNTLTSDFCVEALKESLGYGTPEIFNTDQGSQFTSDEFVQVLKDSKIQISMDGRGRAMDNIFVERLWRTVKYENVYLKGYETIPEAEAGLKEYFDFYNLKRHHQSLDYKTPWIVYSGLEMTQTQAYHHDKNSI